MTSAPPILSPGGGTTLPFVAELAIDYETSSNTVRHLYSTDGSSWSVVASNNSVYGSGFASTNLYGDLITTGGSDYPTTLGATCQTLCYRVGHRQRSVATAPRRFGITLEKILGAPRIGRLFVPHHLQCDLHRNVGGSGETRAASRFQTAGRPNRAINLRNQPGNDSAQSPSRVREIDQALSEFVRRLAAPRRSSFQLVCPL